MGTYDPRFFTDVDGRRVRLNTAGFDTITTPLGNIRTDETSLGHYRMKIWMAVAF